MFSFRAGFKSRINSESQYSLLLWKNHDSSQTNSTVYVTRQLPKAAGGNSKARWEKCPSQNICGIGRNEKKIGKVSITSLAILQCTDTWRPQVLCQKFRKFWSDVKWIGTFRFLPTGIFGVTSGGPIRPKFTVQFWTNLFIALLFFTYVENK